MGDKTWIEKEEKVARALGVHRATIKKWKCHLGISTSAAYHSLTSDEDSVGVGESGTQSSEEDVDQNDGHFSDIAPSSMELPKKGGPPRSKLCTRLEIENEIARKLGTTRALIYKWKKMVENSQKTIYYSEKEKRELIKQFYEIKKKKIKENKASNKRKIEDEVLQQLDISRRRIYRWKKELGQISETFYFLRN
uniref:Uncharacterized protein n=1 Tax=Globodera rostochiensis TaxID=31243 RepID=A0A914H0U9_GLORO